MQREHFIGANFDSPLDLVRPELAKLAVLGGFGRLEPQLRRFIKDERLIRLFSFPTLTMPGTVIKPPVMLSLPVPPATVAFPPR